MMAVQAYFPSYDYGSARASEYKAIDLARAALPELGQSAFLALRSLPRAKGYEYKQARGYGAEKISEAWFNWTKPGEHIAVRWLGRRQGALVKRLLSDGCHPAFFFSSDGSFESVPSPRDCGALICRLGSHGSSDAIRALFNAFDDLPGSQAAFRAGVTEGLREQSAQIWANRDGVANRSEALAVLNAAPIFERMTKKKALPKDLEEACSACSQKAAAARGRAEEPQAMEFSDVQLKRQEAIQLLAAKDDAEGVGLLMAAAGLDSPEAFETGMRAQGASSSWRYWTSVYTHSRAYDCCSLFVAAGDNPWLIAGDGAVGQQAEGNPFLWLSLASPSSERAARFGAFAIAFCQAALRDAESRSPGSGKALCVQSFEQARESPLWNPASAAAAAVNAAAERALLGLHLDEEATAPAPSRSSSRL